MEDHDLMEGRCTAKSKQRQARCKRPAIAGGTVCYVHGGAAPQVIEAARARLERLTHPAITRLGELVAQTDYPSTALSAVKDVLDRNGYGAPDAPPAPTVKVKKLVILIQRKPADVPGGLPQGPIVRSLDPAPAPDPAPVRPKIPIPVIRVR